MDIIDYSQIEEGNVVEALKSKSNEKEFLGSKVYVEMDARTELPFKREDVPVPLWKIISKFIG